MGEGRARFVVGAAEVITIAVLVVGLIVWAVRLEARVDAADRAVSDVRAEHDKDLRQFREDLGYIRTRIDEALAR